MIGMANTAEKVIKTAINEVGYLEKKTNAELESKTANVGKGNFTKYAEYLDSIEFFNTPKNGYDWCAVFIAWLFVQAFGAAAALKLLHLPMKSMGASCTYLAGRFKANGRLFAADPQVGDLGLFTSDGGKTYYHVGIVKKVDSIYVYTVEGNTSGASGVIANGGGVFEKKYLKTNSKIRYARPEYDPAEMTVQDAVTGKTIEQLAQEVIDGKWSTGADRKAKLKAAGYDAAAVQAEVNRILSGRKSVIEIAKEVINGDWGNGAERKARLKAAGYDPGTVQNEVNKLMR